MAIKGVKIDEKVLWKESPGIVWKDYYRVVELSKMRQLMGYDESRFREDWELAQAMALLQATGGHTYHERLIQGCFDRMTAYSANNPDVVWRYFAEKGVRTP